MVAFDQPGIIKRLPPSEHFYFQATVRGKMDEFDAFNEKYGCIGIAGPTNYDVLSFMRMIAKIGYSFSVGELGVDNFEHIVLPVIMGEDLRASHLVGGDLVIPPPYEVPYGESVNRISWKVIKSTKLVIVDIRLLASLGTPQYRVVVGRWKGDPNQIVVR